MRELLIEEALKRAGGNQSIGVDVRIVAATNRNLEAAIAEGSFRPDLYYRINVIHIPVPPLRERKDDILWLARRFLEQGVRYVSLYCASRASAVDGLLNWDAHKTLKADYERHGPIFDQPTAALLTDLKQRGMLADTLVVVTTEFGRLPISQGFGEVGKQHSKP